MSHGRQHRGKRRKLISAAQGQPSPDEPGRDDEPAACSRSSVEQIYASPDPTFAIQDVEGRITMIRIERKP